MLILTRKPGESLYIGDQVKVTVMEIKGNQIRLGIDAPKELRIYREEIYLQIIEENKTAAGHAPTESLGLFSGSLSAGTSGDGEDDVEARKLVVKPISGFTSRKAGSPTPHFVKDSEGGSSNKKAPEVTVKRKKKLSEEE